MYKRSKKILLIVSVFFTSTLVAQKRNGTDSIIAQMKVAAKELLIDKSYPNNIDTTYGGYLSTFTVHQVVEAAIFFIPHLIT